jgi:AcrR family transcriptional regulator
MSVHTPATARIRARRPSLLDVAADVLVADPSASLAEVAEAAGIGRTTLHKHYATRDDLIRAVGQRSLDLWEQALASVTGSPDADGGLLALAAALIPVGPQLAFLWRTPAFDRDQDIDKRLLRVEEQSLAILQRAKARGVVDGSVSGWWLLSTFHSLLYVAAESVSAGRLAPRDAPGLVIGTFLHGIGPAGRLRELA